MYREQGKPADAEAQWRAALAEQPRYGPAALELAELYLAQRRWSDLAQAADHLRQTAGLPMEAAVLRARGLFGRQEYAAARQLLEETITCYPEAVWPRVIRTHVLLAEDRDPAAAEWALRDVLDRDPSRAEVWCNLAKLLLNHRRLAEAVCRSGRTHCPAEAELLLLHGVILHDLGDLVNAETCLLRLLEAAEELPVREQARDRRINGRHYLALVCQAQKRFTEAEAHWRAVVGERAAFPAAWVGLGEVCLAQGRWAELEPIADHLANGLRQGLQSLVLRGRACLARREFAAARQLLEKAIAQAPEAEYSWQALSYVLLQEGQDWPAAERALRKLLMLNPGNSEARHNLEVLLRQKSGT